MSTISLRSIATGAALALTLAVPGSSASAAADRSADRGGHHCSDRIDLPRGWQPEGVTTDGRRLYVGSLADGRLLRVDPRKGRVKVLPRSETGTPAVGVDHDRRRHVLWVAGGGEGELRVHRKGSGRVLRTYTLPNDAEGRFVNDLVVTRRAVYATDSQNAELAVVPLHGRRLPRSGAAGTLALTGDFELVEGFNLNGIVKSGRWLLAVQSATGTLFRIDPRTGESSAVDLGGYQLRNGDGLEVERDLLYVVRNQDNLIAAVELADDRLSGELVKEIADDDFDVPTTAALLGRSLYAVNARFGTEPTPETAYWITRVRARH